MPARCDSLCREQRLSHWGFKRSSPAFSSASLGCAETESYRLIFPGLGSDDSLTLRPRRCGIADGITWLLDCHHVNVPSETSRPWNLFLFPATKTPRRPSARQSGRRGGRKTIVIANATDGR